MVVVVVVVVMVIVCCYGDFVLWLLWLQLRR